MKKYVFTNYECVINISRNTSYISVFISVLYICTQNTSNTQIKPRNGHNLYHNYC